MTYCCDRPRGRVAARRAQGERLGRLVRRHLRRRARRSGDRTLAHRAGIVSAWSGRPRRDRQLRHDPAPALDAGRRHRAAPDRRPPRPAATPLSRSLHFTFAAC
ncbi:hypothetical protein AB5I41_25765 [Sphingomonas sp. MMS24-JH45]